MLLWCIGAVAEKHTDPFFADSLLGERTSRPVVVKQPAATSVFSTNLNTPNDSVHSRSTRDVQAAPPDRGTSSRFNVASQSSKVQPPMRADPSLLIYQYQRLALILCSE